MHGRCHPTHARAPTKRALIKAAHAAIMQVYVHAIFLKLRLDLPQVSGENNEAWTGVILVDGSEVGMFEVSARPDEDDRSMR
jgi:hypothetical protein